MPRPHNVAGRRADGTEIARHTSLSIVISANVIVILLRYSPLHTKN
jgi:hypothetical protein